MNVRNFDWDPCIKDFKLERVVIDGKRHYITPSGLKYPSVTTVLSSGKAESIKAWRDRVGVEEATKISTQASRRGTKVHSLLESYLSNKTDFLKDSMPNAVESFVKIKDYLDQWCETVYGLEVMSYSDELKTAGQCDLIAKLHGINTIIDFKTSSKLKKEEWIWDYFYQATAYALMAYERQNFVCPRICILIATDNDGLQVFHRHTSEFIPKVKEFFRSYHDKTSLT